MYIYFRCVDNYSGVCSLVLLTVSKVDLTLALLYLFLLTSPSVSLPMVTVSTLTLMSPTVGTSYLRPLVHPPPPRDEPPPPPPPIPRGIVAKCRFPPRGGGHHRTPNLLAHMVQNSRRVTWLLLVAKGFWIHTNMHRCSQCGGHDVKKQNSECTASIHQFRGCPYYSTGTG